MRPKDANQSRPVSPDPSSILDHVLPPDPKAPPRPTVPPPTCGTLPPSLPSLSDLLGGTGRIGR